MLLAACAHGQVQDVSRVEKLDSGRVRAVYRDDEGRRRSRTFDRRAEAKAWLAAEATDRARGQWVDPRGGALPFADWAEQWFAGRLVRPTTAASDRGRYATHLEPEFGPVTRRACAAHPIAAGQWPRPQTPMRFTAEFGTARGSGCCLHLLGNQR